MTSFEELKKRWAKEAEERRSLSLDRKALLVKKGVSIFEKYGVKRVVLFGSISDNRGNKQSDVDLLVMPLSNEHYGAFQNELEEELEFRVDLYTQKDSPAFVQKIIERGETIYEI